MKKYRHAAETERSYSSKLRAFKAWCDAVGECALPAPSHVVVRYITKRATDGISLSTVTSDLSAIRYSHVAAGLPSPTESTAVVDEAAKISAQIRRPPRQKAPATADVIHQLLAHVARDTLQGKRDRALLLLGFAGAFRRSELVGIEVEDLTFNDKGVDVFLGRSKTDQEGKGQSVAILNGKALAAADRLREWLDAAGIIEGPIFRPISRGDNVMPDGLTAQSVALIVKKYAKAAGLDHSSLSAGSLLSGRITSLASAGYSMERICGLSRHDVGHMKRGVAGHIRERVVT